MRSFGGECVRCDGFPGNSTNAAGADACSCVVGYFSNTVVNIAVLEQLWFKSNVADHPLSADYRELLASFSAKYALESPDAGVSCTPCPPNMVCAGNSNPPMAVAGLLETNNKTSVLFYTVLSVGAGSVAWWVPCPRIEDVRSQYLERHSVGLSSCFHRAEIWSPPANGIPKLHAFSFPGLLLVNTSNTSIITSIVNIDQEVYSRQIYAKSSSNPVMRLRAKTALADTFWLVQLEMDTIEVVGHFASMIALRQDDLISALHVIDQGTGVAFSTLVPLLWAYAVQSSIPSEMATPVFIIPGVVHSVITQDIAVRTINRVMQMFDLQGSAPRHIFQLSSHQLTRPTADTRAVSNPLFFVHNNICDAYYNPAQGYADCPVQFGGTLLSAYTTQKLAEIILSPHEEGLLHRSNALQDVLQIGSGGLAPSTRFLCPLNTLTESTSVYDRSGLGSVQRCRTCPDTQFWNQNKCQQCEADSDACESYSNQMRSKPCSWTEDLSCHTVA